MFQQVTGGNAGGQSIQSGAASPQGQGGDQSQSIGGGPQSSAQKAPAISNSGSSSKEIIRRNEGKAQSPFDLGAMSDNIQKAKTGLQDEANSYVNTQKNTDYSVPGDQINKALTGDADAFSSVGSRLTQAKPAQTAFNPATNTDYSSKVNQLQDSSLRNYFKNNGGPMATQGDSAFDTMLLNKNKDFKLQRENVQNQANGLNNDAAAIKDKANSDASVGYDAAYDAGTQKIKDSISGAIDPIRTTAEQQAATAEAARQKYLALTPQQQENEANTPGYAEWLHGIVANLGANPAQTSYLNESVNAGLGHGQTDTNEMSLAGNVGYNPAYNFIQGSQAPVTANSFLTPDQAAMISHGNQLLGSKGAMYTGGGPSTTPYSFNANAAQNYLKTLIGQKNTADETQAKGQSDWNKQSAAMTDARGSKILEELKNRFPQIGKSGSDLHDEDFYDPSLLTDPNALKGVPRDQQDDVRSKVQELINIKKQQATNAGNNI